MKRRLTHAGRAAAFFAGTTFMLAWRLYVLMRAARRAVARRGPLCGMVGRIGMGTLDERPVVCVLNRGHEPAAIHRAENGVMFTTLRPL